MNFALTEDQAMIRDAAESFLAGASDSAAVRCAMAGEAGCDEAVWRRIGTELGWCGIAIAEAHGGLGLGPVELALIQEQAGRRLLCAPFFSTVCVGATLLQEIGAAAAQSRFLPQIASGALRLAVPLCDDAEIQRAAAGLRARASGDGWVLDGRVRRLADGAGGDWLLAFAETPGGGPGLFAVPRAAPGVTLSPLATWDATRRFADAEIDGVADAVRIDEPVRIKEGMARAVALARLYLAAEQLGGAQQCLDMTVAYALARKQFGRAIAGFQAIKHRCAKMMVKIEALRSAVYGAAAFAAGPAGPEALAMECSMARALAAETFFWCAQEAIQVHGGVGFTWEYDPQLYFKRAQASSHWLGTTEELREEIARAFIEADGSPLPPAGEGRGRGGAQRENRPSPGAVAPPSPASGRGDKEEDAFRAEVAAWMREHLSGRFARLKHRGGPGDEEFEPALRKDWERELAAGGWTCVGWPVEYGGRGLSIERQVIFHEEYARAGGPGRMGHIGEGLIGPTLIEYGTPEQKARFLPAIVAGREFWAQGYSEPSAGSDLANVQTRCWRETDGAWRVQGQKTWTSLARESDWIFVLARCEPGSKGSKGLAFLLLTLHQPGIEIRPIRQLGGGSEFNEVFFDGARAEKDYVVGAPGDGWRVALALLEIERGVSTLGQQMRFAHELDLVIQAARRNGRASDPAIRARIAQAWCGLRVMRYNALRMLSAGADLRLRREALIYKYYWSNWHRDLGKLAMDVLGADGDAISDDPLIGPLQKLFFFSRADTIYAGTNEIQLNLIAERGLSMPKEARLASA